MKAETYLKWHRFLKCFWLCIVHPLQKNGTYKVKRGHASHSTPLFFHTLCSIATLPKPGASSASLTTQHKTLKNISTYNFSVVFPSSDMIYHARRKRHDALCENIKACTCVDVNCQSADVERSYSSKVCFRKDRKSKKTSKECNHDWHIRSPQQKNESYIVKNVFLTKWFAAELKIHIEKKFCK